MAVWIKKDNDLLTVHHQTIVPLWISLVVNGLAWAGLVVSMGSLGYLVWRNFPYPGGWMDMILPATVSLGAVLIGLLAWRFKGMWGDSVITFDRESGVLEYSQKGYHGKLKAPLALIDELILVEEKRSGTSSRKPLYQLYLVWENQTIWWIWEGKELEEVEEASREIASYLELPMRDLSGQGLDRPGTASFPESNAQHTLKTSVFFEEARLHGTLGLSLRHRKDWIKRWLSLMAGISVLLPAVWFYISLKESLGLPRAVWLAGLGMVVAVVMMLLLLFWSPKYYQLFLKAAGIQIVLNFKSILLNRLLGKKVNIPEGAVQEVRLHRLPRGYFRLSLGLDPDFQIPKVYSWFFNAGIFRRNPFVVSQADLHELFLWDVAPGHTPTTGPYLGDVVALQTALHRQYLTRNGARIQLYNER